MLYYLFRFLEQFGISGSGMWSYISFRALLALILSLIISAWFGEKFIKFFTLLKPRCEVIRCDEVGDIVYVFFRCTLGNGTVNKVVDIYRLEDGMLAEHWDVVEHDVAAKMAAGKNSHGIF